MDPYFHMKQYIKEIINQQVGQHLTRQFMYLLISNIVLTYLDFQSFRIANPDTGHYLLAAGLKC